MLPIGRMLALSFGLFGAIVMSQAPELTQQYRQRIGGAIDELRVLVDAFDRQSQDSRIDRAQALALYDASGEPFLRQQGQTMRQTISRFENLETQRQQLSEASAIMKPLILAQDADAAIFSNTWRDFEPAVPLTVPGIVWAAAGFGLGWLMAIFTASACRGAYRVGRGRTYRLLH